jgi:molecular chaperone DnaJ
MSEKRDYYEVLGVSRDASPDEIRRSYKQAALKYHPDRNPGDKSAEDKFKEATEAYSVLSDEDKRATYDRFGHAGLRGSGFDFQSAGIGDILSQFQDLFSDFFGGMGGFGPFGGGIGPRHRRPRRGQDMRVGATISLKQAMQGAKQEVSVTGPAPCSDCGGSGAGPGARPESCPTCNGLGQVTTQRGFIMFSQTCPRCRGEGRIITTPCTSCEGSGHVKRTRTVLVSFPAGIDTGQRLRVPGQGMPGPGGTPPGDLYVDVHVQEDEQFERQGDHLATRERLSFVEATLGAKFELQLPDETSVTVKVEPGTQPGSVISIKGKGMPRLDRRARGDLHVVLDVAVPRKLSRRGRKLLLELEQELREDLSREARTA